MNSPTIIISANDKRSDSLDLKCNLSDPMESLLSSASPEIQALYLQAIDGSLGLDKDNDQLVAGFTSNSILYYRLLGLSQRETEEKVRAAIEKQLEYGVQKGYEAPANFNMLISSTENREHVKLQQSDGFTELVESITPERFFDKYKISRYQELNGQACINLAYEHRSSKVDDYLPLHDCFALASKIGAFDLMNRIEIQLLRFGDFEGLIKAADAARQDKCLVELAHLLMADFFDPRRGNYYTNYVWSAIDALQRVRGPEKYQANEMLKDLAALLATPELAQRIVFNREDVNSDPEQRKAELTRTRSHLIDYAFYALRQTGIHLASAPIDSIKTDFVTKVDNPDIVEEVQKLWLIVQKEKLSLGSYAFPCLVACGIFEPLREEADRECREGEEGACSYINALEIYAAIGDQVSFEIVIEHCQRTGIFDRMQEYALRRIREYRKILEGEIRTYPIRFSDGGYVMSDDLDQDPDILALQYKIKREREMAEEYLTARITLNPEARLELILQGNQFLQEKDYWRAHVTFNKALYKPGLVQAAEGLLSQKNAINAFKPLDCAVCLPDEDALTLLAHR